jgi:DNA adenine methylase
MEYLAFIPSLSVTDTIQLGLLDDSESKTKHCPVPPFRLQLLKWIGNKQRFAHEIVSYFPRPYRTYFEPFIGSGAVLGTLAPQRAVAADVIGPLIDLWNSVAEEPELVKTWYASRWNRLRGRDKVEVFEEVKASYNTSPNAPDFLFLSRSCYGGVIRFRRDGYISTPCGVHNPVSPKSFDRRVDAWNARVRRTRFLLGDFEETMAQAKAGDVVYCDPPYSHSQAILYGAQTFDLKRLFRAISECKGRGVRVLLSIDGSKRSGNLLCDIPIPDGLFEEEAYVNCGRSMLRRFQMRGESLEAEVVRDRLLLTF